MCMPVHLINNRTLFLRSTVDRQFRISEGLSEHYTSLAPSDGCLEYTEFSCCEIVSKLKPSNRHGALTPLVSKSTAVEKETPLEVDTGYLTVTDLNAVDEESYRYTSNSNILPPSFLTALSGKIWKSIFNLQLGMVHKP